MDTVTPDRSVILAGEGIEKRFGARRGQREINAVNGIDLAIGSGEAVGLVGESGCGKSTLSRILVGLVQPSRGQVLLDGEPVASREGWRALRRRVQYVFQDPWGSLCPTMKVGETLVDALAINGIGDAASRRTRAVRVLSQVGLDEDLLERYPSQLSGGQRQRIGLARALILETEVVICDEIVSGLDVSVQAQILNLLTDLRQRLGIGLLFISHDLRVVRYLCDRILVMYLGQIVEEGPAEVVFDNPKHPYTRGLLASVPDHGQGTPPLRAGVRGEPAVLDNSATGCPFAPRCPIVQDQCRVEAPPIQGQDHVARCHFPSSDHQRGRLPPARR